MKKILVIDGNSIINRAFFGIRALTTKSGKHTNAIYGMINIISKQLELLRPDYAAVAFDLKAPTFRHEMFKEYKAGRHETPPELLMQFPEAKECLELMGLNILELPGYEADDIQGTVACMAHDAEDVTSYILTGDRDLLQLIDDKIIVLLAGTGETKNIGREEFREKYGISPDTFVDMKALMGDSSDNIPGVRGIGEKTAATLIQSFRTLEGIYENLDDPKISKGVRAKLEADRENAFLSRALARIVTDAPIGKELDALKIRKMDYAGLYKKFTELELNSFITKFKLLEHIKEESNISSEKCKQEFAESLIFDDNSNLSKNGTSTERSSTNLDTGLYTPSKSADNHTPNILKESFEAADADSILSLSEKRLGLFLDGVRLYISDGKKNLSYAGPLLLISALFERGHDFVCFRGKRLLHELHSVGIRLSASSRLLDIELYTYVLHPGGASASLSSIFSEYMNSLADDSEPYPSSILSLEKVLRERVADAGGLALLEDIEIPLLPILAQIEENGFKVNTGGMLEFAEALGELAQDLQDRIYMQALGPFNINSPKQLGEVLFVKLGLPYKKKKNANGFSTDAQTLEELRPLSPIIDDILEYRQVMKLKNTYASALPRLTDENSRIHTDFKQTLTATGRLSSAEPNLQNIPIRTKMGREMRRYFIADEGCTLIDADYSQIELRLLAHISDDYSMSEAFRRGTDIHRKTASAVFSVPEEAVNEEMRKRAKAVNFGIVYGISGFSLAKDIGTTVAEANKYIKSYLMMYPSIDRYLEDVVKEAEERGYTETLFGRRRYIHELTSSNRALKAFGKRVAMNAPIQGTAADIMKLAMIRVYRRLSAEEPEAKIVMQVHDELIVEAPVERAERVKHILAEEMSGAAELSVPLTVDVTCGKNWLEQE